MTWFPSLPNWDGIHPAMVHFPIALLLVVPLLLLVSLFARQGWRTWAGAALVLMAIGTFAAWLAVGSGHAAAQLVDKVQDLQRAVEHHEELGISTRNLFTVLTVLFAVVMLLPVWIKRPLKAPVRISIYAVFLVLYLGATTFLAQAANQGGRLVHEYGVRAILDKPAPPTPAAANLPDPGPARTR